jgi:hypothetical protein
MYFLLNIVKVTHIEHGNLTKHVACTWVMRHSYVILVGKSERKVSVRGPKRRWQHNSKMDFKLIAFEGVSWIPQSAVASLLSYIVRCW